MINKDIYVYTVSALSAVSVNFSTFVSLVELTFINTLDSTLFVISFLSRRVFVSLMANSFHVLPVMR